MTETGSVRVRESPDASALSEHLPEIGDERIAKLFREAERIRAQRSDVRAAFPDIRTWDFWFWILWHGSSVDPAIEKLLYPTPPDFLMQRVVGEAITPRSFLLGGLFEWRRAYLNLVEGGFDFERGGRVLDFGCGCGRLLRHFARYAHACEFVGADVDANAMEWCRANLGFATFHALPKKPPTELPTASFDAVYALSVFSHLPEELHRRWLEELRRITRPGAVLVLTVHGQRSIDKLIAGRSAVDHPTPQELERDLARIQESGFGFYPYRRLALKDSRNQQHFEEWDLEQYGTAFILPKYFFERWGELFHIVSWNMAPDDEQDFVILRRRAES